MATKILLVKDEIIELYILKGIPVDKTNPSLNSLERIEILLQQFKLSEFTKNLPEPFLIFSIENPELFLIKEAHSFFKQLIQLKINQGFTAVNLFSIKI